MRFDFLWSTWGSLTSELRKLLLTSAVLALLELEARLKSSVGSDKPHAVLKAAGRCAGFADVRVQLADDDCGNRIGGDRDEGCGVCLLGD